MLNMLESENKPYIKIEQIGFIEMDTELIKINTKDMENIFKSIIPLEIYNFKSGIITYKCLCKAFREINFGEKIPYYNCIYDAKTKSCNFEERK